jgi:hypothetical protein
VLLDRALKATIRDFSTVFLVLFVVIGPLQLLLGMVFHDVLAVRELHDAIAGFPPSRQVRGVGQDALGRARIGAWIVTLVELLLLPLFMRVGGHVLRARAGGEVPTALGAWRMAAEPASFRTGVGSAAGAVAGCIAVGALVGLITRATLMTVADFLPAGLAFAGVALAEAIARCSGGAFVVVGLVYATSAKATPGEQGVPEMY